MQSANMLNIKITQYKTNQIYGRSDRNVESASCLLKAGMLADAMAEDGSLL